jgi:two-component system CheB/CheR fusion protein
LIYPDISNHAKKVISTLVFIESAVATLDERWFNVRIMPYRTLDDRIDGLVMTFADITTSKKLELELREANNVLKKNNLLKKSK